MVGMLITGHVGNEGVTGLCIHGISAGHGVSCYKCADLSLTLAAFYSLPVKPSLT